MSICKRMFGVVKSGNVILHNCCPLKGNGQTDIKINIHCIYLFIM